MTEKPVWNVKSETVLTTVDTGVMVNIPLPVINPPVELTATYPPSAAPVEIYNFSSYHKPNIKTDRTDRFIGNSEAFADANDFWIKSTGWTTQAALPNSYPTKFKAEPKDYVFKLPRQRNILDAKKPIKTIGFIGVAIDGVPFSSPSSEKTHNYNGAIYTENDILNPINYPTGLGNGAKLVGPDKAYSYNSYPTILDNSNMSIHSNIIGYAFDGWPIYGPRGYTNADGSGGISLMTSSHQLKTTLRSNGSVPDGTFVEDYIFVSGSGSLDEYNGRDCITPEYPNGVYAYFATVNPANTIEPLYPYILGPYYKSKPAKPNGSFVYPGTIAVHLISGQLPPGLRLEGTSIVGTTYSLKTDTVFKFTLRAENSSGISDKTLVININAVEGILWETAAGTLPVGNNKLFPIPVQFDPNNIGPDLVLSEKNLVVTASPSILEPTALATFAIASGTKVMFSVIIDKVVSGEYTAVGISNRSDDLTTYLGNTNYSLGFWDDGSLIANSGNIYYQPGTFPTMSDGDIVDVAVDRQSDLIWIRINGKDWNGDLTSDPRTGAGGIDISFMRYQQYYPAVSPYNDGITAGRITIKSLPSYDIPLGFTFVGDEIINDVYYVLDNGFVDYQLSVVDRNLALAQDLKFYIPPNGGTLPLGLSISDTGRITGFTKPVFSVNTSSYNGDYDMNTYDTSVYDYGLKPNNGFDSFLFDTTTYDFNYNVNIPKKLNRYYEFIVRATDGYFYEDRKFKIYVVGDDHFRADTTLIDAGTNFFRADVTYLRKPIWLTPNDLGTKRANNYVTIPTSIYVSDSIVGVVTYILDKTNDDGTISQLPIGLQLDERTGTIYGAIPYQPAISKLYKFTIRAYRYDPSKGDTQDTARTFTLNVIGDIKGTITFTTNGDLGYIDTGLTSTLSVSAKTKVKNGVLIYSLAAGRLPPGLTLYNDGTIQGKVNQFEENNLLGLTAIDSAATRFDGGTTTIDRQFIFTVRAEDQLKLSATTKTFSIEVLTPDSVPYSNVYLKPLLDSAMRIKVLSFLHDINIFTPGLVYRSSDPNFGVQTSLKMLLYPGIETVEAVNYVSAFGRSYKKQFRLGDVKKAVAKLPGTNTVVYEVVYIEVIDNQENSKGSTSSIIKINDKKYPIKVNQGRRDAIDDSYGADISTIETTSGIPRIKPIDRVMSADYDGQRAGDSNKSTVFGNSTTNMRNNLSKVGSTERNYLPLWMLTPQDSSGIVQSFTKAIPLCFCIPGGADTILLNIKHSVFDFKMINYTIDRAIIDSVTGYVGDKYLMFPAREVING